MKNKILAVTFGLVFILIGCFAVASSWAVYNRDVRISQYGGRSIGHVTNKGIAQSSAPDSGGNDFFIDYWFTLSNGRKVETSRSVSKVFWNKTLVGTTVDISFDASRPEENFPTGEGMTSRGFMIFIMLFGLVFIVAGSFLFLKAYSLGNSKHKK